MRFTELLDGSESSEFGPATWFGPETTIERLPGDAIRLTAPPVSDWFHDPSTLETKRSAPMLLTRTTGPATLTATVTPAFADTFDAGVLMAYETDSAWAKLCFERAPDGRVLVVSVVTNGTSDDANAFEVMRDSVHLRVSCLGGAYAFHASLDGSTWELIRFFRLGGAATCHVGIGVQAPMGSGCSADFAGVRIETGANEDIRSKD